MTTTEPNPPPPSGRTTLSDWNDWDGLYRIIWGESTRPEGTRFLIAPFAM